MNEEERFPVGTVVKLISGGPNMAVQYLHDGRVMSQWFAGKKLESGRFPPESLVIVPLAPTPVSE